jgi:hypothetical protein
MITLRLDPKLELLINNTAKNLGITKSQLIQCSIIEYVDKLSATNAWEAGQDLFGKYSSGKDRREISFHSDLHGAFAVRQKQNPT